MSWILSTNVYLQFNFVQLCCSNSKVINNLVTNLNVCIYHEWTELTR